MTRRWIPIVTLVILAGIAIWVIAFARILPQWILRAQVREGRAVMRLLLTSLENSRAAEQQMDILLAERILSSTRLIAQLPHLDRNTLLTAAHLNGWLEAELVSSDFRVILSSRGYSRSPIPVDSLRIFWRSERPEAVMLLGEDTLAVLVRRDRESFLAVLSSLASIRNLKVRLGVATTIRKLGEAKGVRYVAYQTPEGILYAYPEEVTLTAIESDSFLLDHLRRHAQGYRVIKALGTHILEFVAPYAEEEGEFGLLRLGWDLRDYRETVTRIRLMSLLLILVSLVIVFLLYRLMESQRRIQRQRERLHFQEAIRQRTLNSLPVGVLEVDFSSRIRFANSMCQMLLGDQPVAFLTRENDPFQVWEVIEERTLRQGEVWVNQRWISYTTVAMEDRVIVILEDRTEHRALQNRLQEAKEREVVTQLVAGIAHEIRSPLNALSIRIQSLLMDEALSGEQRRTLEEALRQIQRLEDAIRRILDLSRPIQPSKEPVDLQPWLMSILSNFQIRAEQQGKTIRVEWEAPEALRVEMDPKGMQEALENLLENALEATDFGDQIIVRLKASEDFTVLEVEDTGAGIPSEIRDKLFEPHVSTKPGGLGLGLYQVKRMVEAHGGSVQVDSRPGQGTRFTLYIPHESSHR